MTDQLACMIDALPDIVCLQNARGVVVAANRRFRQLFSPPPAGEAAAAEAELAFLRQHLRPVFFPPARAAPPGGETEPDTCEEKTFVAADGRERIFAITSRIVREGEAVVGRLLIAREVTRERQALKTLQNSEEKYLAVLESNPDPVVVYDQVGLVVYLNPAFNRVFGWSLEECQGKKLDHFVPDDAWPITRYMIEKVKLGESFSGIETVRFNRAGKRIPVSLSAAIHYDADGRPIGSVINIRDISRQKELEDKLQRAQKMEAVGLLASGVAHDLNNVLTSLVGYPELLLPKIPPDSSARTMVEKIRKSAEKAAAIVNDMLTLARRGVLVDEIVDLNEIIREYFHTPELEKLKSYHPGVEIRMELADDLGHIHGSVVHLQKTIMNLVSNAAEAMPDGGLLTIRTRNETLRQARSGYEVIAPGDYAVCEVSDTGVGISPAERDKIFEPFYTKKVMGRSGTGLGMSVIWCTVHDYHGYIDIRSRAGQGTTFYLYFPVTAATSRQREKELPVRDYRGHGETILVVDDMEEQRQVAMAMLQSLGYRVLVAESGAQAIEFLRHHHVDLVLLDMIMNQGMDGLETYRELRHIEFSPPVLIVSGFAESERIAEVLRLGAHGYVKKPYRRQELGVAVSRALRQPSSRT